MLDLIIEEIPYSPPQAIFDKLKHLPYPFLLESSLATEGNHFSFAGCNPYDLVSEPVSNNTEKCIESLRKLDLLNKLNINNKPVPFVGGAVGFISYDFGRCIETLPDLLEDDTGLPYFSFAFYSWIFAFDHYEKKAYIVASGFPHKEPDLFNALAKENVHLAKQLLNQCPPSQTAEIQGESSAEIKTSFSPFEYEKTIQKTIDYIRAGDIFQVNISQRFEIINALPAWEAYQRMSNINQSPHAAFMAYPDFQIVCASPERFIKKTGNKIITSPIKGTRKRGINEIEDEKLRKELWDSKKDRAELAMIIDLERNDLNKFCIPGSVHVPELFSLEKFPSVWHLVSDIYGTVKDSVKFSEIITSIFPGGSITGAPKIRAMEIIEELEIIRRGLYTGCIGYIGFDGDFDFNIVIRTAIFKNEKVYVQTGGGITALSDPHFEYQETLVKARKIFQALGVKNDGDFGV